MEIPSYFLTRLTLLLCLISFAAATRHGFIYSRTRGRCTPQYWSSSSGKEAWPRMVPQTSTVSNVFGSRVSERYRSEMTLLESAAATAEDGDAFRGLLKQGSAALLNAYARRRGFPYTAWEVKSLVIEAMVSEAAARKQTQQFSAANQACN